MYDSQAEYNMAEEAEDLWNPMSCTDEEEWYVQQDKQYDAHKEKQMFWDDFTDSVKRVL